MNYLAHAYLSFNEPEILVGNMISDFVKGRKKFDYSPVIQKGIALHRAIDTFTDDHPATKEAKIFFKPVVGLYSGAFIDVVYDHFLANDDNEFSEHSLQQFTRVTYDQLYKYRAVLPSTFDIMLPYMRSQDWLYNYRYTWGTQNSFGGLVRRAKYLETSAPAFEKFQAHYSSLRKCYNEFFPQLKAFARHHFESL